LAITIHDVARRSRVSLTTVSRAFTQPGLLRAETRERVLAVARDLGYHPNRAARSLITGKTGNVGIVVPDLGNPFYPGILRGVQTRAQQAGYAVLLADSDEDGATEVDLVQRMAKQVDGVIICAPFAKDAQLRGLTAQQSLVLVNRRCEGIPAVLMDIARGMRHAIGHLHAIGHRRCAYLGGPAAAWSNRERVRGLHVAAGAHDIELVELGPFEPKFEGGIAGADQALASGATALVAYNDLMALGAFSRLAARGVRVPDEMSVVGFDDLLFASMSAPPLTTVSMPMEAAGRGAVDLLLARMSDPAAGLSTNVELPTQLVIRSTTAPPADRSSSAPSRSRRAPVAGRAGPA
jgi:LacI family transcriptional regulator